MLLLHAVAFAHGGLPLIYMGDELGLRNDPAWPDDPHQRGGQPLDAPPADGLGGRGAPAGAGHGRGAIWDGLRRLIAARRATRATHAQGAGQPLWTGNDHVYGLLRSFAGERLLLLASFSADEQRVRARAARRARHAS